MHNCSEIRERLTEVVLDGRSDEVVSAELNKCAECRAEFEALSATLRMTTRLAHGANLSESYWSGYHARLREKLSRATAQRRNDKPKLFFAPLRLSGRIFLFRLPVPLGIVVIVVCLTLGVFVIRRAQEPTAQNPVIVHVPVEVPVVQEKIVTRVVYRDRYLPSRDSKLAGQESAVERTFARSQKPPAENIPATLTGFKPTEDIKLTVIKGGYPNEK